MGVKIFEIGDGRETIELTCDSPSHVGDARTAGLIGPARAISPLLQFCRRLDGAAQREESVALPAMC